MFDEFGNYVDNSDPAYVGAVDGNAIDWIDNQDGTWTDPNTGTVVDNNYNVVGTAADQTPVVMAPYIVTPDPTQDANPGVDTSGGDWFSGIFSGIGAFFKSNVGNGATGSAFNFGTGGAAGGASGGGGSSQQQQKQPTTTPGVLAAGVTSNTLLIAIAVGGLAYALGSKRD